MAVLHLALVEAAGVEADVGQVHRPVIWGVEEHLNIKVIK